MAVVILTRKLLSVQFLEAQSVFYAGVRNLLSGQLNRFALIRAGVYGLDDLHGFFGLRTVHQRRSALIQSGNKLLELATMSLEADGRRIRCATAALQPRRIGDTCTFGYWTWGYQSG